MIEIVDKDINYNGISYLQEARKKIKMFCGNMKNIKKDPNQISRDEISSV